MDPEIRDRCRVSPRSRNTVHFVYREHGHEAAFLALDVIEGADYLVLYEIYVPLRMRGNGIGGRALAALAAFAAAKGCSWIYAFAHPIDGTRTEQDLERWYVQNGFCPRDNGTGELELSVDTSSTGSPR
mgnify:FL=1